MRLDGKHGRKCQSTSMTKELVDVRKGWWELKIGSSPLIYAAASGTVGQLIRVGPLRLLAKMPMSGTLFHQETLSQTLYVPSSVLEAGT